MRLSNDSLRNLIELAIKEDVGTGDITTNTLIARDSQARAVILAKEDCVAAGVHFAREVFRFLNPKIKFQIVVGDGRFAKKGKVIARLSGDARAILSAERVALNFLAHLSGIATKTKEYVNKLKGCHAKILDTRKTTPGLRLLEKYAVRMGGGFNHRFSLDEQVLIKDNHLKLMRHKDALACVFKKIKNRIIEIEVENLAEFRQVILGPVNIVMLDNMKIEDIRTAVKLRNKLNKKVLLEVSGCVKLENIKDLAETGVDFISTGDITHSVKSIDFSLEITTRRV